MRSVQARFFKHQLLGRGWGAFSRTLVAQRADQALRDGSDHGGGGEEGLDADIGQPGKGANRTVGVKRRKNQMPGQRGPHGDLRSFAIPYLADHQDIGILAKKGAQRRCVAEVDIGAHLHLVHAFEQDLHGVLDGQDLDLWAP